MNINQIKRLVEAYDRYERVVVDSAIAHYGSIEAALELFEHDLFDGTWEDAGEWALASMDEPLDPCSDADYAEYAHELECSDDIYVLPLIGGGVAVFLCE